MKGARPGRRGLHVDHGAGLDRLLVQRQHDETVRLGHGTQHAGALVARAPDRKNSCLRLARQEAALEFQPPAFFFSFDWQVAFTSTGTSGDAWPASFCSAG